jgi:hypothetical protein
MSYIQKQSEASEITISASEIHKFFYCPYAWWFRNLDQEQLEQLQQGKEYHIEFDKQQMTERQQTLIWLLPVLALILTMAAILFYFIGGK